MRRREFIAGLGGGAAWPLAAQAQQQPLPVVGVLQEGRNWSPELKAAFMQGLAETGYIEGRNVLIEGRFSGDAARLGETAADLVRRRVAVIAAPGNTLAALAAKAATNTIPIIFSVGVDPVQTGLVRSLNQPGGNLTGYTEVNTEVWSKRLELLRALAPTAARFGALDYPGNPVSEVVAKEARAAAEAMGLPIEILSVRDDAGVELMFSNLAQKRVDALLVSPGAFFYQRRDQIIRLAASHGVAAAYHLRGYPEAGGLMSYGSTIEEGFRQVGVYTGNVLKGAKPADLPVVRTTKFELVINAKTAKALGLTIPPQVLAIADEVIE
jgi:putative tryptophan/tyrosine transport system substrate-binding protein